jgi:hypothetical protein
VTSLFYFQPEVTGLFFSTGSGHFFNRKWPVKFYHQQEVTGSEVLELCRDENPKPETGFLVADNPVFAPILYKKNLPFSFIQGPMLLNFLRP